MKRVAQNRHNNRVLVVILVLMVLAFLMFSCSDDSTSSDNEPPTVAITYPANNSEIVQGTIINITADATDNEEVKEVRFYVDGSFASLDGEEPYEYEWDTGNKRDTDHTIYAKAYDTNDNKKTSEVITITIVEGNQPPDSPSNPNPADNANSISINTNLSWNCSDPDNDSLTYDVYFGTELDPPLVNSGQSDSTYDPGTLDEETIYYWQIIAHDDHSNSTTGYVWQFSTSSTVTDIDGNVYQTMVIGDQEWMIENLKVTHYRNGDTIPNLTAGDDWTSTSGGAYCYYDNDPVHGDTYGALYNRYAVDDPRGLAPEGWHVPTDDEIKELEMYLGMSQSQANSTVWRGTNEGSKLAGGYNLWTNGDLRNDPAFNTSGFSFLPGGTRYSYDGAFGGMVSYGLFWSSTESASCSAWGRTLYCNYATVSRNSSYKRSGFSVRCVRD